MNDKSSSPLAALLQLTGLIAVVIAQPVFAWISGQAEFLVAHDFDGISALALIGALCVVLPLACWLVTLLARPFGETVYQAVVAVFVGLFTGLLILQWLNGASPFIAFSAAAAAMVGGAVAYFRAQAIREVLSYLALAAVAVPLLFVAFNPVRDMVWADQFDAGSGGASGRNSTIVFLVLDELPLSALLDERGNIDGRHFPGFAALAAESTWFPNATTVSVSTTRALPAFLTGNMPDPSTTGLARWQQYPQNLFTWAATNLSGEVIGVESITRLCPDTVCDAIKQPRSRALVVLGQDIAVLLAYTLLPAELADGRLPVIDNRWHDFLGGPVIGDFAAPAPPADDDAEGDRNDPIAQFENIISADRASQWRAFNQRMGQGFNFLHVLMPHDPYTYLPDGQQYEGPTYGMVSDVWEGAALNVVEYQRMLAQLQFTDALLMQTITDLKARNLWTDATVVVAADHGKSFRTASHKRNIARDSLADLLRIPLFIKRPGQTSGETDRYPARIIDVAPTIAALAERPLSDAQGVSLFGPDRPARDVLTFTCADATCDPAFRTPDADNTIELTLEEILQTDQPHWKWAQVRFSEKLGIFVPAATFSEIIGQPVSAFPRRTQKPAEVTVEIADYARFVAMDADSQPLPAFIEGKLEGADASGIDHVGIAVNGQFVAVTRPVPWRDDPAIFTALAPATVFESGGNSVSLLGLAGDGDTIELIPLDDQGIRYTLGQTLKFGGAEGDQVSPYLGKGWSGAGRTARWTDGPGAHLYLEVSPLPEDDVTLRLRGHGFLAQGEIDEQRVTLLVNDREIADWPMAAMDWYEVDIPADAISARYLHLEFRFSNPAAPCDFGHSPDCRKLGMAVDALQLVPAAEPRTSPQQ